MLVAGRAREAEGLVEGCVRGGEIARILQRFSAREEQSGTGGTVRGQVDRAA
jgi:hypothetical protein